MFWKHAYKNTLLKLADEQLNQISTKKYYEFLKHSNESSL